MKNFTSIRAPLLATISLILVAGFLATNLISYQVSKQSLRQALIDNELPLTSNNIFSEIQRDLLQPVFVASLMANDTFVKDWLIEGENDPSKMTRYLEEIRAQYGVFTSFLISDATRNYYHFSGISQVISEDDPKDVWYFRVRDMEALHELNVDPNAEQGDALTIFINHKVFDSEGNYLAATGVGLEFDTVAKIVERYRQDFDRHVYFVNQDGTIMVRSHGATITQDLVQDSPELEAIAARIMSAEHGFFEYERDGEIMLVSTRYIPDLKWRVIVEQSETEALSSIRETLITNSIIGVGVIVLTMMVLLYTVNLFYARLETMATTDKLTGLGNRSLFDLNLEQAIKHFHRTHEAFSVLLFDLDHFKRVNDEHGHLVGDHVLKEVADILRAAVRESDVVCRWGGEELIVLANACDLESAIAMADKIRLTVCEGGLTSLPDGVRMTLSGGVTQVKDTDDTDAILQRADTALYKAKEGGRNMVSAG